MHRGFRILGAKWPCLWRETAALVARNGGASGAAALAVAAHACMHAGSRAAHLIASLSSHEPIGEASSH
eukprot:6189477-Pleurochrysis_carterae.AAC.5